MKIIHKDETLKMIEAINVIWANIVIIWKEWNQLWHGYGSLWQKDSPDSTDGTDGADVFRWLQVFWRDFLWLRPARYDHPPSTQHQLETLNSRNFSIRLAAVSWSALSTSACRRLLPPVSAFCCSSGWRSYWLANSSTFSASESGSGCFCGL